MMRWLDPLGAFKWPSLLLIASPLVAYASWVPRADPAEWCGRVSSAGQAFNVYRRSPGEFILRPSRYPATAEAGDMHASGVESGGMLISGGALRSAAPGCFS